MQGLNSQMEEKVIVFLGSSVTYGECSGGVSFADLMEMRGCCRAIKEAVSGTTLVDAGPDSYVSRLKRLSVPRTDLLICQLSTNDATQRKPLGAPGNRDTATVAGEIEEIIAIARARWRCPILFYTNPRYDSPAYGEMVRLLKELQAKWGFVILDLWNDAAFNDLSPEQRARYMADAIHPTRAGYEEWWLPKFMAAVAAVPRTIAAAPDHLRH